MLIPASTDSTTTSEDYTRKRKSKRSAIVRFINTHHMWRKTTHTAESPSENQSSVINALHTDKYTGRTGRILRSYRTIHKFYNADYLLKSKREIAEEYRILVGGEL